MANATETKFGDPATRLAQTECWTLLLRPNGLIPRKGL